jgi:hypothetical protein
MFGSWAIAKQLWRINAVEAQDFYSATFYQRSSMESVTTPAGEALKKIALRQFDSRERNLQVGKGGLPPPPDVRYALACRLYRIHSMLSLTAPDDKLKRIGHQAGGKPPFFLTCKFPNLCSVKAR